MVRSPPLGASPSSQHLVCCCGVTTRLSFAAALQQPTPIELHDTTFAAIGDSVYRYVSQSRLFQYLSGAIPGHIAGTLERTQPRCQQEC